MFIRKIHAFHSKLLHFLLHFIELNLCVLLHHLVYQNLPLLTFPRNVLHELTLSFHIKFCLPRSYLLEFTNEDSDKVFKELILSQFFILFVQFFISLLKKIDKLSASDTWRLLIPLKYVKSILLCRIRLPSKRSFLIIIFATNQVLCKPCKCSFYQLQNTTIYPFHSRPLLGLIS